MAGSGRQAGGRRRLNSAACVRRSRCRKPPPPTTCMLHGMSMSTLALQCQQVRCPNCSTTLPLLACEIRLP